VAEGCAQLALKRELPVVSDRPLAKAGLQSERVLMPDHGPGVFEREVQEIEDALLLTTVEKAVAWAQTHAMWPDTFGLACCAIEMMATFASRFDVERLGMVPWASPRHADLMIVSGTVTIKMAPMLKRIYEQMADPKWCISMGSCANSGGPFRHGYHVVKGVDRVVPVDIYVPGCPPTPESLMFGIVKLHEKVAEYHQTGQRSAPGAPPD